MKFKLSVVVVIVLGLAALLTNPSQNEVEAQIEARLLAEIDAFDPGTQQEPVLHLIAGACQLGRSACAGFIRSLMDVQMDDRWFYSTIDIRFGRDHAQSCIGVFSKVVCR